MTTISQIAKTIDALVQRELDDPFEMEPRLYGCHPDGAYLMNTDPDPYDLLWSCKKPEKVTAVAMVVTGWAAPIDESDEYLDRPSHSPDRIRVRMVVCIGLDGFATVMRRADQPDDIEDLTDEGEGVLRDALEAWWSL